jgi:RNase P/RNase MRP subunit POP5
MCRVYCNQLSLAFSNKIWLKIKVTTKKLTWILMPLATSFCKRSVWVVITAFSETFKKFQQRFGAKNKNKNNAL